MRSKSAMILNKHVQNQRLGSLSRRKQLILKSRRAITCLLFSHSKETILKPRKQTLWNTISQDAKEHFCLYSLFLFDINNVLTLNYNHQSSDSSLLAPVDFLGYQEVTYLCFLLRQKKRCDLSAQFYDGRGYSKPTAEIEKLSSRNLYDLQKIIKISTPNVININSIQTQRKYKH